MTAEKDECVDCKARPFKPSDLAVGEEVLYDGFRPKPPRKIDPRSLDTHKTQPRCATDWLVWDRARKAKQSAGRSRKRSGLTEERRQELLKFQGGVCPCGRGPGSRQVLNADHDHDLARQHDHPEEVACEDCLRGFLCGRDNWHILGLLFKQRGATNESVARVLFALGGYLLNPPMRQLQRQRDDRSA